MFLWKVCGASAMMPACLVYALIYQGFYSANLSRYSQPDQWEAHLGLLTQGLNNKWTVQKRVKQIISHPEYDPKTYDNDIALMELENSVSLSQNIWPICLPAATHEFPAGQTVWITGWGKTKEEGSEYK